MFKNDKLFGVLDIDSDQYNAFNEADKKYLEEICEHLAEEIFSKE